MELTLKQYSEINEDLLYSLCFDLSRDQIEEIFNSSPPLVEDYLQSGWDTATREHFADIFCLKILGHNWPCGCDNVDQDEFTDRLDVAAKKFGYKRNESYHDEFNLRHF